MNTIDKIEAKIDTSEYGYEDFLNYKINDYWLDEKLEELYPDNFYGGTIPTLLFGMEIPQEEKVVWDRIFPKENETTICPILMCPDDNDFSCILIVAEIKNKGNRIYWNKLGIDKTKENEAEKVGTTVKWLDKVSPLEFSVSEYNNMYENFKNQYQLDKLKWEKDMRVNQNETTLKKAIIIGASSGIGKGLAQLLVKNDYKLGITGRKSDLLEALKNTKPEHIIYQAFDATHTKTSIEKLKAMVAELGGLDLLIISSGTGDINKSLDFEIDKKVIDLNVSAFSNIANWAFNFFEKQGFGHMAAISSVGGLRGSREAASYNASKAYQINYLEGLRQKSSHSKKPIYISDIRPGLVDTDMAKGEGLFWVMPVEKVCQQIFKAIQKKRKVAYITKRWGFIGRLLKVLPRFVYDKM